ncbi:MAG: hypothetical protein JWN99_263 [Ilumatobacteraceae bacterium]|nr:hypothetical protein [Ilumatobacteraceae bacterium]
MPVNVGQADELAAAVRELRELVTAQAAEIAQLRSELAAIQQPAPTDSSAPDEVETEPLVTGRRRFFALAAGAAAAATAVALGSDVTPVAASNSSPLLMAVTVQSSGGAAISTVLDYSPTASTPANRVDYLRVSDKIGPVTGVDPYLVNVPAAVAGHARSASDRTITGVTGYSEVDAGNGVLGIATGAGGSYGVWGISDTGNGIVGLSRDGYDRFGLGSGRLGLASHVFVGPPRDPSTNYTGGDIIRDSQGALWACVVSGAPGVWRKLAGPTTAGSLHTVTPTRVFDSRWQRPGSGLIPTGEWRTISVADGRRASNGDVVAADLVPDGATAIACNITVTDTFGSGFAVVNPGDNSAIGASTINWSHADQTLANGIIVGIDDQRRVTLVVGGGGLTNMVVDVTGYFL